MHSRPLSSLSGLLLVAFAVGLGSPSLLAQNSSSSVPTPAAPAAPAESPASRIDIFAGYSYLKPSGNITTPGTGITTRYSPIDLGALGSVNYFFNRYIGAQVEVGAHPDGKNDGMYTGMLGLVLRYPTSDITMFAHAGAGVNRLGGADKQPYTIGPALGAGIGMDYNPHAFGGRIGLRLFQADYVYTHTNFGPVVPPPYTGGRANLNNIRFATGLLFHMGSILPPPPVTYSCSASPASVFPGDPITVTGTATNVDPKRTATYSWTAGNGAKVTGTTSTGNVDTTGLSAGDYTVTGHVSEGQKVGQFADCTANFTVKAFEPPTISCSANPSTVAPGGTSTITAQGVSPQNRQLTYTYSASSGQISGTGSTATLSTAGAPAGPITVNCNVQDDKGQTASATTTVNVEAPPPPPAPTVKQLCSITFGRNPRRPERVDNEAKACLDDVALNLQQQSDASAVLVGEAETSERDSARLAAQRAVNAKAYLVTEKGIDSSRISVRTGTQGNKEVENYLVPQGATFDNDVQGTTAVDESTVHAQATRRAAPHHVRHPASTKPATKQ